MRSYNAPVAAPRQSASSTSSRGRPAIKEYLARMCNLQQMDFQAAATQMVDLCTRPSKVYKMTRFRKQIKNQWARDDPAFVVLLAYFIAVACMSYIVTFGVDSAWHFARIVVGGVVIEFILLGCVVATVGRLLAHRFLRRVPTTRFGPGGVADDTEVEWLYAFDVHCNAFFPSFFMLAMVGQYFLTPLLMQPRLASRAVSNLVYAAAAVVYLYVTFLGYSELPFLHRTRLILVPVVFIVAFYFVSVSMHINFTRLFLTIYFGDDPPTQIKM
jgi:hypothetical protein